MAQVKLIETEQPQQFKPVTIQITFETQEEINAMDAITGYHGFSWDAVKDQVDVLKTDANSWRRLAMSIYNIIKSYAK